MWDVFKSQKGGVAGRAAEFEKIMDTKIDEQIKLKSETLDLEKKVKIALKR
jgi:hypothetical protein